MLTKYKIKRKDKVSIKPGKFKDSILKIKIKGPQNEIEFIQKATERAFHDTNV